VEVKKENLTKLLTLVKEIQKDPQNKWFKDALLADIFGIDENTESQTWITKINMIEKYLSIDGFQVIDYSFIENERVRNQLICDNIEMSRHRLGKRTGKVDFEEFCRFATLQIEEMLNYFYAVKFNNNLNEIINYVNANIPESFEVKANSIGAISLWSKFEAFITSADLKTSGKLHNVINMLIKYRNEGSHRNSLADKKEEEILREAEVRGFFGYVDFKRFTPAETNTYNKVQYILFKRKQEFDLVALNLEYFKEAVRLIVVK
jgi:hypothetical protein